MFGSFPPLYRTSYSAFSAEHPVPPLPLGKGRWSRWAAMPCTFPFDHPFTYQKVTNVSVLQNKFCFFSPKQCANRCLTQLLEVSSALGFSFLFLFLSAALVLLFSDLISLTRSHFSPKGMGFCCTSLRNHSSRVVSTTPAFSGYALWKLCICKNWSSLAIPGGKQVCILKHEEEQRWKLWAFVYHAYTTALKNSSSLWVDSVSNAGWKCGWKHP